MIDNMKSFRAILSEWTNVGTVSRKPCEPWEAVEPMMNPLTRHPSEETEDETN
jgi:hypothetical protein